MLQRILSILNKLLWLVVLLIVLSVTGRYLLPRDMLPSMPSLPKVNELLAVGTDHKLKENLGKDVRAALDEAEAEARTVASARIDSWLDTLRERTDSSFLPWFFSYLNQQAMGLKGLYYAGKDLVSDKVFDQPSNEAAEKISESVQRQFATRVLRPKESQLEVEAITKEALQAYVESLSKKLENVRVKYRLPQEEWERYLADLTGTVQGVDTAGMPLGMKLAVVTGAAGAAMSAKVMTQVTSKISSKLLVKSAGKMASKSLGTVSAKVAGKIAGELGTGGFLGPLVAVAVIAWDLYDHFATKAENQPILRAEIFDYFQLMKQQILDDPETGIFSILTKADNAMARELAGQ